MGDGVLGSRVGGFQGAFSSFFSSATALLRERALLGSAALLRSAVPLKALWRDGAAHRGAAVIIVAAIAASQPVEAPAGAQCSGSKAGPSEYLPRISGCLFWQSKGRRLVAFSVLQNNLRPRTGAPRASSEPSHKCLTEGKIANSAKDSIRSFGIPYDEPAARGLRLC